MAHFHVFSTSKKSANHSKPLNGYPPIVPEQRRGTLVIDSRGNRELYVGIDEAGRGPVLGPMVYAAFGVYKQDVTALKDTGVNDSKALSPTSREAIFARITKNPSFYHEVDIIEPQEISRLMSSERAGVNLNSLSHNSAASLIQKFLAKSLPVKAVYLDTVGDATKYQQKLQKLFPGVEIVVTTKADSKYVSVGAASIVAKVTRDRLVSEIEKTYRTSVGCGYPSDPITVRFLKNIIHPFYGFPEDHVRLRWKTCENLIDNTKNMVEITFDKKEEKKTPKKFYRKRDRPQSY